MNAPASSRPLVPTPRPSRLTSASHCASATTLSVLVVSLLAAAASGASTQRATNTFVSLLPFSVARFDEKARCLPSGENIGKPSKPGAAVMRSRPEPSTLIDQMSNSRPFGSPWFEEKRIFFEPGAKNGAKDAASRYVTCFASDPSALAT